MKNDKPLIRRTFLQERFLILIERQQAGEATFAELTELDELVNRDPKLRDIILEEMDENGTPLDNSLKKDNKTITVHSHRTLQERVWAFVNSFHFYKSMQGISLSLRA